MRFDEWISAQTASGATGALLAVHAAVAIITFERSGPPCHFCLIEPGLGLAFLEIVLGVPLAVLGVAVFSTARFDPTFDPSRPVRLALLVGSILVLGGTAFVLVTMTYGLLIAWPLLVLGYVLVIAGLVGSTVTALKRVRSRRDRQ